MNKILSVCLLGLCCHQAMATNQDLVLNVRANIVAYTCKVDTLTLEKETITMDEINLSQLNSNQEVDGMQTGKISFFCPLSANINVSLQDGNALTQTNSQYLTNKTNTDGATGYATGVGVKLYIKDSSTGATSGYVHLPVTANNVTKRIRTGNTDEASKRTTGVAFTLNPRYFRIGGVGTASGGDVHAIAQLTFSYE